MKLGVGTPLYNLFRSFYFRQVIPTPQWYQVFRDFGDGVTFIFPLSNERTLLIILGTHLPLAVKTCYLGKPTRELY